MLLGKTYPCTSCKKSFAFQEIRYSKDGKKLVCKKCYALLTKPQVDKSEYKDPRLEIIKLICVNCRYKFSRKKGSSAALRCPYCGKSNFMRDDITAEKLIEEVSGDK